MAKGAAPLAQTNVQDTTLQWLLTGSRRMLHHWRTMGSTNMFRPVLAFLVMSAAVGGISYPGLPSANDTPSKPSATAPIDRSSRNSNPAQTAHGVPLFPSASDRMSQGFVRVINRSGQDGEVTIAAIDDTGFRAPGIALAIGSGETAHFNSEDLEQGNAGKGLSGGTGPPNVGDWRLELTSDLDIEVLAYIRTTDGFLTAMHDVVEQGLTGGSPQPGSTRGNPSYKKPQPGSTRGNPAHKKPQPGSARGNPAHKKSQPGSARGYPAHKKSQPGSARGYPAHEYRVAIFNPGRNTNQKSLLRLINPGAEDAEVTITAIDDAGTASGSESGETGAVHLIVPAGGARTVSATALESKGERGAPEIAGADPAPLTGELGVGAGKWQLLVTSEQPVVAMSLLKSPTGHLTNLSTAPYRATSGDNVMRQVAENTAEGEAIGDPVTVDLGADATLTHSLEGPDAESFAIDAASGQLRTREGAVYDFEARSGFELIVKVTDGLGGVVRIPVTVEVTDVDEPPDKPTPPEVEGVSSRSVRVSWDEPENTGPEITDYDVAYRRPGAQEYTDAEHEGAGREIEITHLRERADYEFRVRASNAEGTGTWSEPTVGRARSGGGGGGGGGGTITPPPPPPPATNEPPEIVEPLTFTVQENDLSVGRVQATDANRGDSITGFAITGGADDSLFEIAANGNLSFLTAPDHERPGDRFNANPINDSRNNEYIIEIEAQSGTGARTMTSDPEPVTVTVTNVDEPPLRPDRPAVESSTQNSLSITWQPPVNTGPTITDYDYRYQKQGSGSNWDEVIDTTVIDTRATIIDLDEETDYNIQVRATNDEGTSLWSRSGTGTTQDNQAPVFRERPRAFRNVAENTTGTVDLGGPLTADDNDGGTPAYSLEGADAGRFQIDDGTGQLRTASGAAYDHEADPQHEVTVRADDGQGGSSTIAVTVDVLDELEPPVSPAPPRVTTLSTTSVAVTWTAPANAGRPPIRGYDVQRRIKDSGDSYLISNRDVRGTSATTGNLDPQTTYEVQVRANNDEGEGGWSLPGNGMTDLTTPAALFVAITSDAGSDDYYKLDDEIEATVTFSEAVAVRGSPQLSLTVGSNPRRANYADGSGTAQLIFAYEVTDTDTDTDGVSIEADALQLNGGTVRKDGYTLDAILTHGALTDNSRHKVDGIKPRLIGLEANGTRLTLTYSETLDDSPGPASGDFQVAAGATAQTVQSAVASGVQVTLTLASDVALGDAVAVTYTAGTNPIRDLAQNAAAEFSSRAATNLTAGVCNRTQQVEDAIVAATPVTACGEVTAEHLAGIGYLELSSEGIGELQVGDFAGLTGLNDLFLDGNLLETLPDGLLSGLSALQLLWLDDNQLNALPAGAFSGLSALVTLDLEGNDLDSVDEQFFAGLTALEKLDLSDNSLETLPAGTFSDLAALESLNLEDNALSALTAGVFSALVALEELDLSHNALDDLAGSPFSSLAALTWLDLDGNDFETLPAGAFSGLAKLRTLWLADNEITMLPATVFSGLTATTWIDLDGNQLATLPGDLFDGLSNLARLWLADNQFTVLPDGIFSGLTALRRLKLEENPTDPLPLTVALQSSSSGRFQVSVPAGAPFAMTFPVRVTNGSLSGSGASVAIAQGSTHSSTYSVSRTSGSTAAATVDIAALPPIPDADTGYELVKSADLPLEVIAPSRAVKIFPTALTVREGGDNRYRAVLNSKPSADATITVTVPSGTDVEANPTSLTFTPDNWQDPQWVTVSAMTDTDTDDDSVTLSHSVQGGDYQGVSAAGVAVTVAENLPATNESPSIASDDEFELTEHNAAAGAVAASDADTDDYITGYAISGGVDAGQFEITDDGALSFVTPPNHETPQDLASTSPLNDADNNEYIVQVEATGGTGTREQTVTQTITVTVNDADEPPSRPPAPVVLADDQAPRYLNVRSARERLIGTGPEITDYDVQYRVKDGGNFLSWSYSGAELDTDITGLERNTAYEVQVRATNDEGTSDWSPSGEATTHNEAPQPDTRRILADVVSAVGAAVEIVDLSGTFREPDNDGIGFSASSSNSGVASVTLVKSFLAISPGSAGTATITVTASDPYGASATRTFKVTVRSGALRTPTASISGDTLTVEFTDRFAADEVRAYQIRVRQSSPRGRWVTRCTAVAKPTQGNHSVALNATIAGLFEPGTTYEVDYGHTGTACGGGLAARSAAVEQATAGSSSFDIELVYVGTGVTSALRTAANAAAERWGRIITGDIPNVDYSRNPVTPCWRVPLEPRIDGVVDDVRIYVEVQAIDGSGGAVATGQACRTRDLALLPIVSVVEMDSADLGGLGTAVLQNVVLHELGHALGFDGSVWKDHGLLKNPSLAPGGIEINPAPDTHFSGALARAAFNAAGGSSYTGAKVPVENGAGRGSARDSHWRFSVFGRELMATGIYSGGVNPLSAVTVRAFADMGYQVDVSQADTYALSSFSGRLSAGGSPSQLRCGFEQPVRTTGEFQPMDPKPAKPSRASLPAPRFRRGVPERPRDLRR